MAILSSEFFSVTRKSFQSFMVILPFDSAPGLDGKIEYNQGPFKTIYLLHGYSGSRNDWLRNSPVALWAQKYKYAFVMPDGANSFYLDNVDTGEQFGDYIGKELISVTRLMFPLSSKREDTVIAGLSMGGFGALRNGFHNADTFGAIIALSPALITDEVAKMTPDVGNGIAPFGYYRHTFGEPNKLLGSDKDPKHLAKECQTQNLMPKVFLACGAEDFLYPNSDDFHSHLNNINYPHVWWQQEGKHDFDFWNKSMPAALDWLLTIQVREEARDESANKKNVNSPC